MAVGVTDDLVLSRPTSMKMNSVKNSPRGDGSGSVGVGGSVGVSECTPEEVVVVLEGEGDAGVGCGSVSERDNFPPRDHSQVLDCNGRDWIAMYYVAYCGTIMCWIRLYWTVV